MTTSSLINVTVPSLGESVTEAVIAKWLKHDGEAVGPDDVIAELETDKAALEMPAPAAGVLKIIKSKGSTVKIGDLIATVDPAGTPTTAATPAAAPKPAVAPSATPTPAPVPVPTPTPAPANAPQVVDLSKVNLDSDLSPAVRTIVLENHLEKARITASGKDGRLTKEDVLTYLTSTKEASDFQAVQNAQRAWVSPTQAPVAAAGTTSVITSITPPKPALVEGAIQGALAPGQMETRIELSKLRQTIAKRLVEAQHTTASLTTFNEVDMTAVLALREKYKEKFEKTYAIGLGFMSFFAKAVMYAFRTVPNVNALLESTALVQRKYVHLGIAVSTERGLMVPVVRNAHLMSMAQIELEIKRLAGRAREGKITVDEMAGGTFTITNGGIFGSLLSTPIINYPQSAILGMHKIEKRALVVTEDGQDKIVIRPMMYVALTYDHRVIDGQQSVTFLVKVKEALEDPSRMILEI